MDDTADLIIAADKQCRSWREKLDLVRGILAVRPPDIGELADVAIYLRFLGTGRIRCSEDGRHFRPGHHARIASEIQQHLAQLSNSGNAWIIRKIFPSLPSAAKTFQRAEPLTRIRDIAHRNDIPSELKKEIKTTLQNKLHRCAGPEDLATSAALLERITAPGAQYPPDFVEQFNIFHEELKEFFNARSLEDQLASASAKAGENGARLIREFLAARSGKTAGEQFHTFELLTELRGHFLAATLESSEETQELLMADIALEDFAFVLLSELLNAIESGKSRTPWEMLLGSLLLTIVNLALSGVDADECRAIESELRAWRNGFDPSNREHLLRLKATSGRARRAAGDFSDRLTALFVPRVEKLGGALGVDTRAIRVFCEAEIRGHLVFQLSKLVSILSRHLREALALPAWDVIVSGRAEGRVKSASRLEELAATSEDQALVLLKTAEGDEEIPKCVAGILLAHDLPHLSHLGVRARQAGVVLVACDEAAKFNELLAYSGRRLTLIADSERFELAPAEPGQPWRNGEISRIEIPEVNLAPDRPCISLEEVSPRTGGQKAFGARQLAEWAARQDAGFRTPPALVIPFGVMENAMRTAGIEAEYLGLIDRVNGMSPADFTTALEQLRLALRRVPVSNEILSRVTTQFGHSVRLIVRSSANCEDLEQFAGAGLYESIPNVSAANAAEAVRSVWASLWTRRAALSRKQAGIPHSQAHMAVLIQQMLEPEFSFVLHTVNPISNNSREVYAELAAGLGETLASAASPGNPYRLACDKISGRVTTLALANFSYALVPDQEDWLARNRLDYSRVLLTIDPEFRRELGKRLAAIGRFIEQASGKPQDVEGVVVGSDLFLVQSRPQQGLRNQEFK